MRRRGAIRPFCTARKAGAFCIWSWAWGGNTPGIVKFPFWRMTAENPKRFTPASTGKRLMCPQGSQSAPSASAGTPAGCFQPCADGRAALFGRWRTGNKGQGARRRKKNAPAPLRRRRGNFAHTAKSAAKRTVKTREIGGRLFCGSSFLANDPNCDTSGPLFALGGHLAPRGFHLRLPFDVFYTPSK